MTDESPQTGALSLETYPVHLGLGARAEAQPAFTGMEWYADYAARTEADGAEGRLVSMYEFTESWTSWEMHPAGDELVVCLTGTITLHQELADGDKRTVTISAGQYAINPPGAWHTADISAPASALFVTAGMGTENRPR
ncbi:cupin domain [Novosphingobium sp. PhB165]|uniref:cupin domain-containing protein n=1 Tax=Novosphingobium sp. PhB165 TaxID=2485105 RepID=UPI0010490041|nr:cupin domain-containing protein [Novosphingobium sp. PhB165]TCM16994.1 cupin domain [Novosphingobium sp. PhB165]